MDNFCVSLRETLAVENTHPIGSSETGLLGPYEFPFCWTFQRNRGRRGTRRRAHRLMPEQHGVPLFVEAGPVPVKYLRHLMHRLAVRVAGHLESDIGPRLFEIFPCFGSEAWIDFLDPHAGSVRAGSQMLIAVLRNWFTARWSEVQKVAIASGQYFPPPRLLRARVAPNGGVRTEVGFARGFLPFDRLLTAWLPPSGTRLSDLFLLDASEPFPIGLNRRAFIQRCAGRFAQPHERVVHVDGLWNRDLDMAAIRHLHEGDELIAAEDSYDYSVTLYANGQPIGTLSVPGMADLRIRLLRQQGLVVRVIRLGFSLRPEKGRIVVAIYERNG